VKRWIAIGVCALLPMAAMPLLSRSVADLIARRVADAAAEAARALPAPTEFEDAPAPGLPAVEPEDVVDPAPSAQPPKGPATGSRSPARKGIMVRREVVRAAVRAGVRPSGAPVPATNEHPAGLQVYGLGGVGALRDGDVITRVGGGTPRSVEDVIGVVAGAYRSKAYVVSGEFSRDGEKWNAVVELPIPDSDRGATSADRRADRRSEAR
jgi:hypothetical protein